MPMPLPPQLRLLVQGAAFVLVLALWLAVVLLWKVGSARRTQRIHERLGIGRGSGPQREKVLRLWHDSGIAETTVRGEARRGLMQRLDDLAKDAGWSIPMPRILLALAGAMGLLFVALQTMTANLLIAAVSPLLLVLALNGYLQHCISRRSGLFMRQLVDALELGARSLRAGHPLSGSFHLIAEEIPAPVGAMFADICEQESLGVSLEAALQQAAGQSRSADMRIFAASVIIQLRSGGNLADMMERVTWVVRERMRLSRRARVLTAEAKLSKWILVALPLFLFVVINIINPSYMRPLYTTFTGKMMLLGGGVGLLLGSWVMDRMAVLKY